MKTLSAEAIAERLKKPLYMVGAGELGTNPRELETALRNILDIAKTWNAILLIDEADIFLEKRSDLDIHRNAMVGIFLRLLEYYQGILFLTTNRAENIDDAFFSRISMSLHYKPLDTATRAEIWKNIIKLYNINIDVEELAAHHLNGRQIKNCIRIAISLAKYADREVTIGDFRKVISTMEEFEESIKTK